MFNLERELPLVLGWRFRFRVQPNIHSELAFFYFSRLVRCKGGIGRERQVGCEIFEE